MLCALSELSADGNQSRSTLRPDSIGLWKAPLIRRQSRAPCASLQAAAGDAMTRTAAGTQPWVTACIPTYRCTRYLRDAVLSLLNQTYPFLRVVVINDGDPNPPWAALADITDPRLLRFDLKENRGPYFALAVALEATPDPFFLIQDADDVSAPNRAYSL